MRDYQGHNARHHKTQLQPRHLAAVNSRPAHHPPHSKRARGADLDLELPFAPPENWYEPAGSDDENPEGYEILVQSPGPGFRHVVTPAMVRERLSRLPERFLHGLEIVQLSRMTRKKRSFPCYGMQWGACLYLYPMEESLIEYYGRPPRPAQLTEAKMYGGRWLRHGKGGWKLVWTEQAIQDFFLNNVLIHELGHLLDDRNSSFRQRERYAEWFAIHYGYRPTRRPHTRKIRRRHHSGR